MNDIRFSLLAGWLCILLAASGCKSANDSTAPVSLTWEMGNYDENGKYYENSFVLKNISDAPLGKDWEIFYSQFPRKILPDASSPVKVEQVNATYFKMYPGEGFTSLAPGDSLKVIFKCDGEVPKNSHAPEGAYWVSQSGASKGKPLPVALDAIPLPITEWQKSAAQKTYDTNLRLANARISEFRSADIIPSVKKVLPAEGEILLEKQLALTFHDDFANEAKLLKEKLTGWFGLEIAPEAPVTIVLDYPADDKKAVNEEYYELHIAGQQIRISGATPHGVFNGTQTLLGLLKGQDSPLRLEAMSIQDYPDLLYRGQMIDIARNYTTVDNLKKLIDILSSYKLNVLHFHFSDDEGWRLEIPGLEELTTIGARRGHTVDEKEWQYPAYNGGYDPFSATTGNGYYTRAEFIDFLQYAAERHIQVIPEIESPGHARAAIVSMKARYNKYMDTDPEKAKEYLLSDLQDTSRYISAQAYTDNVMNIALPSTYRFMEKVIQEIVAMYKEANVPLTTIHLGGDEVARGAWMGSPLCQALMEEHGMAKAHDLAEYFITRVVDCLQQYNLSFNGWQEVALEHKPETHTYLSRHAAGINSWKTVPEWKEDEIPYQIANNGYPVILCNVNNFYLDLAYDAHPDEPGHFWGGYVDESKAFSMLPYDVYRSSRTDMAGNPVDVSAAGKGKTTLTASGRKNIKGVQAQLFAETIRGFQWVEYYMFPKVMGLVERGWNAHPDWETLSGVAEQQAFDRDLSLFYEKISMKEMPCWSRTGVNFRLPHPGLSVKDGLLYANTPIAGGQIRYTTDGTEPTVESALWEAPVTCRSAVVKAKLFFKDKQSVTSLYMQ
ncbi:family 20 glycosylhydrolase [Bacteroides sp. GM023]|uniref:family 20 glycosylhydrolase n=1 Tax=Bacteroides sp. GM023 TaxID=2723058 RepID=UPI00168AA839|nr:family 20 glycosylhydrolase [Bacteroides sp. GM023]MBD3588867.1 family 20 glycosylhydrolase [Bacteroides sp. GM023]